MSIEAMKLALESCEAFLLSAGFESSDVYAEVRAAIKQAENQEPVATATEAMSLALDALQGSGYYDTTQQREAITALRQAIQESALQRLTDIHQEKEMTAIAESEKQEPVTLEWDEVFDAAAAAYCRSEASRKALRLCFQSREQPTQISIGWTANELMAFAKTISYICTTLPAAQRQWVGLTYEEISASVDICEQNVKGEFLVDYARAIEANLKERNT